jgi:hypothetical protein
MPNCSAISFVFFHLSPGIRLMKFWNTAPNAACAAAASSFYSFFRRQQWPHPTD